MKKLLPLLLLAITASFSYSCMKDSEEINGNNNLNNVEVKYVASHIVSSSSSTTDTLFIEYYFPENNENVYDTIFDKSTWESPVFESNSGDTSYCKVVAKAYSSSQNLTAELHLELATVDPSIEVYLTQTEIVSHSSKASYSNQTIITSTKAIGAIYTYQKK